MPTIYGTYRSRASRNIWLAEEIGLDLTISPVWQAYRLDDPHAEDAPLNTLSPEFLALSPMGAVPVMTDGDLVLTESMAINLYLARRYGGEFGPRDEEENAHMEQWALFAAASLEAPALVIQNVYTSGRDGTEDGQADIALAVEALKRPLAVMDRYLGRYGHPVGGRFTVADINLAEVLRYAAYHAPLLVLAPAAMAWLAGCQGRPAFRRMWERREAEPLRAPPVGSASP